jgi:hypothetical protein
MTNANYLLPDSSFNPPDVPDEDRDEHLNIADKVEYFLEHCPFLSDYVEDTELLSNLVNFILNDAEDDKEGRIRDVYSTKIKQIALWVENDYTVNNQCRFIYNAMLRSRE